MYEVGSFIIYDDGRKGHQRVRAEVLESNDRFIVVQFEDRISTTRIALSDSGLTRRLDVPRGGFITVAKDPERAY